MAAYPSISCSSDPEYARLFPFFVLLTIAVCALPLLLFGRLFHLHRNGVLWKGETRLVYGIFVEPYKPYAPLHATGCLLLLFTLTRECTGPSTSGSV
jgi:hypothetical protein